MNNNDTRHPAQKPSGPNKYLQLAMLGKVPVTIYFNDGEILEGCALLELDTLNLLVKVVNGDEMVVTRSTIKKIVATAKVQLHTVSVSEVGHVDLTERDVCNNKFETQRRRI